MKTISLVILLSTILVSCSGKSGAGGGGGNAITLGGISAAQEEVSILKELNLDPNYELTLAEVNTLKDSGTITDAQYQELLLIVSN